MIGDVYRIRFIIPGMGDAEGELIRIKGPHLTELINRNLPITSRGLKRGDMFVIPTQVLYAIEKPKEMGRKGDIAYDSKAKAIIILLADQRFDSKMAVIGTITRSFKIFENLKTSAGVKIEKLD
ncbi:MAG: hypothetical protein GOP50_10070 [Candidatus Heimdallarchaeota archaeon]|nr:hypothetical protein [Candidatus Heimdallarchaeota archaeon]